MKLLLDISFKWRDYMKDKENAVYQYVKKSILKSKKKHTVLKDIYNEVKENKPGLFNHIMTPQGYLDLHSTFQKLCDENIIEPTKSKETNGMTPPLKNKYRKIQADSDSNEIVIEMMKLNNKIDISKYYLNNHRAFINDKESILVINEYLNNPSNTVLTINERSWELFKDEKFLKSPSKKSNGEILLRNLGLKYEDLNCYYAYEPFIFFNKPEFYNKQEREILIIENKDTFWSFHNLLFDSSSSLDIDMLIYGEGNKINSSFQYSEKLEISSKDKIWYFGDIDREGLNIFNRLKERYPNYKIEIRTDMYEYLLNTVTENIPKAKKNQRFSNSSLQMFLGSMDEKYRNQVTEIIDNNLYIPQEVMNYKALQKIYNRSSG